MNRRKTYATLMVPTLVDAEGLRHIIPSKDQPAYCGAEGAQEAPREHRSASLCQRCVQKYIKQVFSDQLTEFGL